MLVTVSTALVAFALSAASPQAPLWEADYGKALKQTRSDDRPLLIVLDQPGAEKKELSPAILGADKKLLKAYDLCRVNVSTEYGQKVAKAFEAKQFPYVAILDKTGSIILHSQAGEMTTSKWTSTLTKYQSGERAVRYTVAKPIVTESHVSYDSITTDALPVQSHSVQSYPVESTPVYSAPVNYQPMPTYNPPADCPNCRRGY